VRLKSLFDEDIDVEAELQDIDAETDAKNAASEQSMLERVGQRDRERRERRAEIEAERAGTQETLDAMQAADRQQREAQFDADLAASQAEVEKARREWQQAIAAAQSPEEQSDTAGTESGKPQLSLPEIESSLQGSRSVLDEQQRKVESKGGFNALGIAAGLGADSLSQRTAKATEQVAVNTKTLVDQAKRGRLVFTE
jgi:hypothetical protein